MNLPNSSLRHYGRNKPLSFILIILFFALFIAIGAPIWANSSSLVLATTTSTQDSGLLEELLPPFEKQHGVKIKVLAVGTGQALELGKRGDVEVLMVHAPEKEEQFVKEGYGLARRPFMFNDFIVVGPKADPGGLRATKTAKEAFRALQEKEVIFVSRGDESGTHTKEKSIWKAAKIEPKGSWYLEAGTGMAGTLRLASEKAAYTLSDRATFLAWREKLDLVLLAEGDPIFRNIYSVLVVSPKLHPEINQELAELFADYLFSADAREIISDFGKKKYGEPLFHLLPESEPKPKQGER